MATPRFTLSNSYKAGDGDFLLLPYCDGSNACFPKDLIPSALAEILRVPDDEGKSWTVFSGKLDGRETMARLARLDAPNSDPKTELRKLIVAALSEVEKEGAERVVIFLDGKHKGLIEAAHEGAILGGYRFDIYLSKKKAPKPVQIVVGANSLADARKMLKPREEIYGWVNIARDLLNEPPNVMKPDTLARRFEKMGRAAGLKVTVWDEKRLQKEKCGGILGVGQGSSVKPRLVIGEYNPAKARKHLCLVGKGVTFDTGGYCLKPSTSQVGMKYDMGGAAMMFAAACAIARLKLPLRVTVITPLVENMISGDAYQTTAILTTRSGRTVEVHNTDAEGRLILSDALALGSERKPDWLIDSATLTGACVVALGEDIAAIYGTDADLTRSLMEASREEAEFLWEMPLHTPYAEQMKTTIADCKNIGSKYGGSITAALFLKNWVPGGMAWVHMDVAGPAGKEDALGHLGKGAKGFGVKTIVRLARQLGG
ncbi:leucyl aminopeptidase [bacterium]|nr:leucyl aminopeptidase [bacterium]